MHIARIMHSPAMDTHGISRTYVLTAQDTPHSVMCILRAICTAHSAVYWAPFSHVHIARDMRVFYTACRLRAICKAQLALISQHLHMPPVNDKRGAYCAQYVLIMHTAHIARNGQTVHIARNVKICILSAYRAQYAPFSVPCYAVITTLSVVTQPYSSAARSGRPHSI